MTEFKSFLSIPIKKTLSEAMTGFQKGFAKRGFFCLHGRILGFFLKSPSHSPSKTKSILMRFFQLEIEMEPADILAL